MSEDEVNEAAEDNLETEEGREEAAEDDEIEPWEEGFIEGANMEGQLGKCANCGDMITAENCVEKKIDGELKRFCSEKCFEKYEEKHAE
ncbi:MAG: hypothetical protein Q7R76_03745 [Candidatus Woesearchaeota archaeon]|nr:hypothetical protein [Candidatus Woesearchaeota archaeon]